MTNPSAACSRSAQAIPPAQRPRDLADPLRTWPPGWGYRFKMKYASVDEVTEEIRRVVPIYRGVVIDDPGTDGVWDAGLFALAKVEPDFGALASPLQPDRTLALDCLEARFAARFRRLMEEANAHRAPAGRPRRVLTAFEHQAKQLFPHRMTAGSTLAVHDGQGHRHRRVVDGIGG